MQNPSGPLRLFLFFLGGSYLYSGAAEGRESEHGNFVRCVPIPTSVFSRVRIATLVLHFPTAGPVGR
jgi:hypothetical protein